MILKGLNKKQLTECLDSCQDKYDNNLMFNRFDMSRYVKNIRGIEATAMEKAAIIAKVNGDPAVISIYEWNDKNTEPIQNPFVKNQVYTVFYAGGMYDATVWYKGESALYMDAYIKTPRYVVDFLKNNINPNQITFTLKVRDSKKAGHRVGFSRRKDGGRRRLKSACWHAHRDVMKAIFDMNPESVLKTAKVYYKGKDDFYEKFEDTGYGNIGSIMEPILYRELCECHGCA